MQEESLSAFLDGECSPGELDRLLDSFDKSPEAKARWARLVLVREVVRGRRAKAVDPGFAAGVMAALEAEERPAGAQVIPLRAARARNWQPAFGFAAAAGVAGLAVAGWLLQPGATSAPAVQAVAFPAVAGQGLQTVAQAPAVEPEELAEVTPHAAFDQQLAAYVIDHSNYRVRQGMGGTLGYARFAAHNAIYHPGEQR